MKTPENNVFNLGPHLGVQNILVWTPSESSFRIIERVLGKLDNVEVHWHSSIIDALADIFMRRPPLILVFGDTNPESLEFARLVRNHADFKKTPLFAVLPENIKLQSRLIKKLQITEIFQTPVEPGRLFNRAHQVIFGVTEARK